MRGAPRSGRDARGTRGPTSLPSSAPWGLAGVAALAAVVLTFGAEALKQVGGAEPNFDASAARIHSYFAARHQDLFAAGEYLAGLGLMSFAWFVVGLYVVIKRNADAPEWLSLGGLVSGILFVSAGVVGWALKAPGTGLPRDLGWWAVASGAGLLLARPVWTTDVWYLPYLLFWLWVLTLALACLRHAHRQRTQPDALAGPH